VAAGWGKKAPVAIRVKSGHRSEDPSLYLDGLKKNKFGIDILMAPLAYREASRLPHLEVMGIDCHIGSQLSRLEPVVEALRRLKQLVADLRREGMEIRYLTWGGTGNHLPGRGASQPTEYASTSWTS